jgi:hypothetical protein
MVFDNKELDKSQPFSIVAAQSPTFIQTILALNKRILSDKALFFLGCWMASYFPKGGLLSL